VLAATRDGDLQAWDAVEGVMVARLHGRPNPGEDIVIAALSPDRSLLAAYEVGGVLNLWELPSGRLRSRTEDGWHSGTVAIEFSADGSRLLVSEFDDAWLLDASTGLQVASWAINCLNAWFTPRGSFVLVEEKRWLDSNTVKTHWRLCDAHTGLCKDTISDAGVILRCPEPPPDFQACATDCFDRDAFAFRYHDPRHGVVVLGARDINTRWLAAPPFHGPITAVAQNPGADCWRQSESDPPGNRNLTHHRAGTAGRPRSAIENGPRGATPEAVANEAKTRSKDAGRGSDSEDQAVGGSRRSDPRDRSPGGREPQRGAPLPARCRAGRLPA
jgi:hypothetical protein